jgi:hypothetical protein
VQRQPVCQPAEVPCFPSVTVRTLGAAHVDTYKEGLGTRLLTTPAHPADCAFSQHMITDRLGSPPASDRCAQRGPLARRCGQQSSTEPAQHEQVP